MDPRFHGDAFKDRLTLPHHPHEGGYPCKVLKHDDHGDHNDACTLVVIPAQAGIHRQ
ncbi:MAG: hypothetical protein KA099_08655 [Alphaproteobacteria bacterium]|nr:hypothetical protein [Alphaproteobacteria bacterium]MBP7759357.1 hypothetical protein [Alphaproteobacteria bacterium]MBP7762570.1 hypothetical protein [Alphaproteobacteria bacterium]MBP7905379.1 hypothetical protein [Alphaproteobacteria bacterium]